MRLFYVLLFQSVLAAIAFGISCFGNGSLIHPYFKYIFAFFVVLSIFNLRISAMALANKGEKFIPFMATTMVIRLVLSLILLVSFIFLKVKNIQLFAINFIVLYLCNLCYEIWEILSNLRRF
jgi:hypothetical protein